MSHPLDSEIQAAEAHLKALRKLKALTDMPGMQKYLNADGGVLVAPVVPGGGGGGGDGTTFDRIKDLLDGHQGQPMTIKQIATAVGAPGPTVRHILYKTKKDWFRKKPGAVGRETGFVLK